MDCPLPLHVAGEPGKSNVQSSPGGLWLCAASLATGGCLMENSDRECHSYRRDHTAITSSFDI